MSLGEVIRPICRALSGKRFDGDVTGARALKDQDDDELISASLLKGGGSPSNAGGKMFVHDHGTSGACVESERVPGPVGFGIEALATPPLEFNAKLPDDYEHGKPIKIPGPHGPIEVVPPEEAKPGEQLRYRLAPPYEFRVEVPPGAEPGLQAKFKRADGVEVCVPVPPNLKPGETFEVLPPALMVRVPDGLPAGTFVVFRHTIDREGPQGAEVVEWCRAKIPEGYTAGQYFAARLPVPSDVAKQQAPE